ncbi:MAG: hypothetical protein FRX48_00569 [Lasallia pustulata]|uniref:Uncharacterized protein n=1 Tax=Lasallia pustulata TaxID=136370 RepID=A0A1W5D985_9LECA|nr:MAG: hypothetical protein FRX48_00569 [Lasallia pustulata]SLM39611.1 hypothetical protein LPUS_10193 [Lasallia pustulata]
MSSSRYPAGPSGALGNVGPEAGRFVRTHGTPAPSNRPSPRGAPTYTEQEIKRALGGWTPPLLRYYGALDLPGRDCQFGDLKDIHVLLQRGNFRCTDFEYAAVRRALCLASAFLFEPVASAFWYSLVFAPRRPVPHIVKTPRGGAREANDDPWFSFSALPFGPNEMVQLNMFWAQMQDAIIFEFIDDGMLPGDPFSAITHSERWVPKQRPGPLLDGGHRARMGISRRFIHLLGPFHAGAPPHQRCYVLREDYILAVTILHELCHAVDMVLEGSAEISEPFFEDMREAELGFAWEQTVLNGRIEVVDEEGIASQNIARHGIRSAEMGLYFTTWPGTVPYQDRPFIGKYPLKDDDPLFLRVGRRQWKTSYLVMMEYIQDLAFRHEWRNIARDGPNRLKMKKLIGRRWGVFDAGTRAAAQSSGGDSLSWGSSGAGSHRLVIRDERQRRTRRRKPSSEGEREGTRRRRRASSEGERERPDKRMKIGSGSGFA